MQAATNSLGLSLNETQALHREMVEMDLAIRNLASGISMGYHRTLLNNFHYLAELRTLKNYRYKEDMRSAITKMKNRNVYFYIESIQAQAQELHDYAEANGPSASRDYWHKLQQGYGKILDQCRNCHEKTLPPQ